MEEIKSYAVDQDEDHILEDKIITNTYYTPAQWKGKTFVRCIFRGVFQINSSSDHVQAVFIDCIFENTVRIEKGLSGSLHFSACKLRALVCSGNINSITIDSFQEKKSYIKSLIFRDLKVSQLHIEDSIIDLFLQNKCRFGYFELYFSKIKEKLNSNRCFYEYWNFHTCELVNEIQLTEPDENSCINILSVHKIGVFRLKGVFRNIKMELNDLVIEKLIFTYFKNIRSVINLEEILVKNEIIFSYSNLGQIQFNDCNLSDSVGLYWYSMLDEISTIRTSWFKIIRALDPLDKRDVSLNQHQLIEFNRQMKLSSLLQKKFKESLDFYSAEMEMYFESNKTWEKPESLFFKVGSSKRKTIIDKFAIWIINPFRDFLDVFFILPFTSKRKNWADCILMYFNKYSNRFGKYWIRPVLLYFIISYVLFAWIGNYKITFAKIRFDVLKDPLFAKFLNPIHKFSLVEILQYQNSFYSFLELFTLVVQGYLIYQIIRSFRKFSFKIF